MEQDHFFHLLQELTVDCKDDQTAFVVQDRILILKTVTILFSATMNLSAVFSR